ncbi:MAG: hypothetical protein RSE38_02675 [Acinetobacter sp.]|nr:hypothetical protein [Citrobacter freundii]HCJ9451314.1 hypothetical protein [Escherichia coli]
MTIPLWVIPQHKSGREHQANWTRDNEYRMENHWLSKATREALVPA